MRLLRALLTVLAMAAFAAMGAIVLLEWAAGCGESYVDAHGERHVSECLFIPTSR